MSQLKEDLERAQAILEERGWCRKGADTGDPEDCPVCLESAIAAATMGDARLWAAREVGAPYLDVRGVLLPPPTKAGVERHVACLRAVASAIGLDSWREVWVWNDRPNRTVEEVRDALRRAIEGCDGGS